MSDNLFEKENISHEPLAARMRARTLDEYIGQDHIVGKGRLLRRAIAADQLSSVIFYGPPGSGKTTLARVIANHTKSNFITLNAVLTGVADIRAAIKKADDFKNFYGRRTILFVDEVHRWNKAQQDALLPWVENGTIILIGATTENPFFEVNKALVSRSRVFQLKPLTKDDLQKAAYLALNDTERGYGHWKIEFEDGALEHLIQTANGDARSLLNALELAVETTPEIWSPNSTPPRPAYGSTIYISREAAEESIQKKVVLYDRDGDYHYDIISAFIKSLRGRDADAAMYWLARMVRSGEDPHFIFRRMLISACEDTGLADPYAVCVVESCARAFDRVGLPEGRYHLAHAALYLATAPKSNSSMAFFDALSSVEKEDSEVPNHLRDASRDAEGFGHGAGYLYPHAYRDHWVAQQYLPDALVGKVFYNPSDQGYEKKIRGEVLSRRELQIAALLEDDTGERPLDPTASQITGSKNSQEKTPPKQKSEFGANPISEWWIKSHFKGGEIKKGESLTFSPNDASRESTLEFADKSWRQRIDSNRAEILLDIRDTMIAAARLARSDRSLVWNADDSLLLWQLLRECPEGITCGICRSQKGKEICEHYATTLDELDKPILIVNPNSENADSDGEKKSAQFLTAEILKNVLGIFSEKNIIFDKFFFRNPFANEESILAMREAFSQAALANALPKKWQAVISQQIPNATQHISSLVEKQIFRENPTAEWSEVLKKMSDAEVKFFGDKENPLFSWNANSVKKIFEEQGFKIDASSKKIVEKRRITQKEILAWFESERSAYGAAMRAAIGEQKSLELSRLLQSASQNSIFNWQSEIAFFTISG